MLDVTIPAVTNFLYNPNTEEMVANKINVTSNTNAPIYINLKEINVSELSNWKPTLVAPTTYTEEQWRNLTKSETFKEVALGVNALEGDNWLYELNNTLIWSSETSQKNKLGTIKNHGEVQVKPTLKSGNSLSTGDILTTNYIFEFGLEEGEIDDSGSFDIDINDDFKIKDDGSIAFAENTWVAVGSTPQYIPSENAFHVGNTSLSYYQYNLPNIKNATFELKSKTLFTQGGLESSMAIETGNYGIRMYFYPDRVIVGNITHYLKGNEYHTYRIVKEDLKVTIYVDGKYIGETNASKSNGNRFFFGDGTSGGGSDAYFKDIRIAPGETLYLD